MLFAGDFYDGAALDVDSAMDEDIARLDPLAKPWLNWMDRLAVPIFAVRGNHDWADPLGFFRRAVDVTGLVAPLSPGWFVAGVGWHGKRHTDLPGESDLEKVCWMIRRQALRLVGPRDRIILLTHYPPRLPEVFDYTGPGTGWTFQCVRELAEELKPIAIVQGHIHEWFGRRETWRVDDQSISIIHPGPNGNILTLRTD